MKRILFLGASPTQVPPLKYAREKGYYVITCDNVPANIGHRYADESFNLSTTDEEGVLALARRVGIDGVVAYASDPAAPTAAYVGNALGLPSNPYDSVITLARKDRFREFQARHGFTAPRSRSFVDREDARAFLLQGSLPAFVKPVDSSGSKGVTRLTNAEAFDEAFDHAMRFSRAKKVVVEEGIARNGRLGHGDGFIVGGQLVFRCWGENHFDERCNGLVPIGTSFPSTHTVALQTMVHQEAQRLLDLLGVRFGALNFEFYFDAEGRLYFLEIGPRNGGNLIPDVTRFATGVDLIAGTVEAAIGNDVYGIRMVEPSGFWANHVVHATRSGTYRGLFTSDRVKPKVRQMVMWADTGMQVRTFLGSNDSLGCMILRFDDMSDMHETMHGLETDEMQREIRVELG